MSGQVAISAPIFQSRVVTFLSVKVAACCRLAISSNLGCRHVPGDGVTGSAGVVCGVVFRLCICLTGVCCAGDLWAGDCCGADVNAELRLLSAMGMSVSSEGAGWRREWVVEM